MTTLSRPLRALAALLATAAALVAGCAEKQVSLDDPLLVAADREQSGGARVKAIEASTALLDAGELDQAAYRESLKRIAWAMGDPSNVRIAAIDALLADVEADTRNMLRLMLPREVQWPVIGHVCEVAAERGWSDMTPSLVRSYSRAVPEPPDDERPERAALIALNPGSSPARVAFDVFSAPNDDPTWGDKIRADAWTLLCRLDPSGADTSQWLAALPPSGDPVIADLQASARDLHAAPTTGEQLEWLRELRAPQNAAFWQEASRAIASLTPEQQEGLELRHASAVRWAARHRTDLLASTRDSLLGMIEAGLVGAKTHRRYAEDVPGGPSQEQRLVHAREKMVWGDALLVLAAMEAMRDPDVAPAIFEQVEIDRRDTSTEHGGVLDCAADGSFVAYPYPPRPAQRMGDNRFIASPELLAAGNTALYHYHFHARRTDESEYAGPGPGDLEYAARFGRSCLVLTSISADVLDVDYYQPNGAVLDLGEIRRTNGG